MGSELPPEDPADRLALLAELARFADTDNDAMRALAELFQAVRQLEDANPPDADAVWSMVEEKISRDRTDPTG